MAYLYSTSREPVTPICVRNNAINELQWRTRDLLQLTELTHPLGKTGLWKGHLPISRKTAGQIKTYPNPADESPWIKVAGTKNIDINVIDLEEVPQTTTQQVKQPADIAPASLTANPPPPSVSTTSLNTGISQTTAKLPVSSTTSPSWSWNWLGAAGLVLAAAGGGGGGGGSSRGNGGSSSGGGGANQTANNTPPNDNKQTDINQQSIDTTTQLQGMVMAGPLKAGHSLTLDVFDSKGIKIAESVGIEANGQFSLNMKNMTGKTLLIQVRNKDSTPDFTDEASGLPKDLQLNLRAVITLGTQNTQAISVTPLTELAAQMLLNNQNNQAPTQLGQLTPADISAYSVAVSKAFGIDEEIGVTELQPVDLMDPDTVSINSNSSALKYAKALAVLSSIEKACSTDLQVVLNNLQQGMTQGHNGKLSAAGIQV